jgi:hypothetical protein
MFSTFKFAGEELPSTVPGAPTSVAVVRSAYPTVSFAWNAPVSDGNSPITGYIVTLNGVGSRSVGLSTLGGYQGRTFGYAWGGLPLANSYSGGSVQAVNSIGTGVAASGGPACAFRGELAFKDSCDGYTRYDAYTDGSCGYYSVVVEYNSSGCGYSPPQPPGNVGVSRFTAGSVRITWDGADGAVTGYGVYITNQNGGFTAASTTLGPNSRNWTFGTDNHGSYNGYVYTINAIGNSSVAGGGAACAYYGYNFTTGNCDGYTRYDINTDGGCGFYRVDTEYNSPSCGYVYNPCAGCAANGTFLYSTCDQDDYRRYNVYANGCCGVYQITEYNVVECGYNPCSGCPARATYFYGCSDCSGLGTGGCDFDIRNYNGCCGYEYYCEAYACCG